MTGALFFTGLLLLSFLIFLVPKGAKYFCSLAILAVAVVLTSVWGFLGLTGGEQPFRLVLPGLQGRLILTADPLSAFFILIINITVLAGFLYAAGYLKPYYSGKNALRFSIHFFSYLWLYFSMILVVMIRDGLGFLIAWEIMALSSFLLVIFDAEDRSIMKTGISYLIQMHAGMFFILAAFLLVDKATGVMSFDSLQDYFSSHSNIPLFLLFFTGFGIKAGFIPLHTWLPEAHPAAPSHVSGVMSGVMIKMGIYGIVRVLFQVQDNIIIIGIIILAVSLLSGVLGVMMAIVQHDLKRLLAYHSIENIGIIGIGLGLGMTGIATGSTSLALLGFSGGLLHVLNHSLFKSLLFFSAGSVYSSAHTRNIELLGGLMKKMPWTAWFFLIGSLAICGLPPFNGFISEYLIYLGMFRGLSAANLYQSILLLSVIVGLSLIGGLAIFCFTKAFGIAFLGSPRSVNARNAMETDRKMILPQIIPVVLIVFIGLASPLFVGPVSSIVTQAFDLPELISSSGSLIRDLSAISILSGIFILTVIVLLVYRRLHLEKKQVKYGPTWGCGYTAATSRHQYTATSYSYNYNHLAGPVLQTKKIMPEIREDEIFPSPRSFVSHSEDVFKKYLIGKPVAFISDLLKRIAVMQTGKIQHYILYAFIFMLLVLLLTYFNVI